MGRFRKMLVAVDGSESSMNAFRQACAIARGNESWMTALTAVPVYPDQFEVLRMREKVVNTLREEGERILAVIEDIADELDMFVKTRLEEGSPFHSIIDTSEENNYDLIVMGRRGRSRLEKAFVGSVTARVIGHSQRDVLVVPQGAAMGWGTILLATDGSKYSDLAAERAINLARSYGSNLHVVSVVDVNEEFYTHAPAAVEEMVNGARQVVEVIGSRARAAGVSTETFVREGETYQVIGDLATSLKADVIVMGSHGRTGIRRLLMGSSTEKVIGYAPCPVLVVKG